MVNFTSIVGLDAASFKDIGVNNDDAVFEGCAVQLPPYRRTVLGVF